MVVEEPGESSEKLVLNLCGGRDFLSKPVQLSSNGKYIFCAEELKVTMFSTQSGLPIKSVNTGKILSIALSDKPGQLLVATNKMVALWDYEMAKMVSKHKYFTKNSKHTFLGKGIMAVYIPTNFTASGDVYITCLDKKNANNLMRVNVFEASCNQIFKNVSIGTQHIGDNNNSLVTLSNHKIHGFKNSTVLCYDRNLTLVQGYNTDRERPFTIVRCHPTEKTIACGDSSGRILVFDGVGNRNDISAAKSILHWHSLPVTALSWSLEGEHLYSGGGERVLCKWFPRENNKPAFLPRLNSEILRVDVSETATAVSLNDNSVLLLDRQDSPCGELVGLSSNSSGWPAGLQWDHRTKSILMNGKAGHIQVFNPETKDTHCIDITQQNYLTEEREKHPFNAEVNNAAVSSCGMFMATIDCCWTPVHRINLKFWHFDQTNQKFVLNTQVDTPHVGGAHSLEFQPMDGEDPPLLLTVGYDKSAKVWTFKAAHWDCLYSLQFRDLPCQSGGWSVDGSVLAVAFSGIITLWDTQARLRTTLTINDKKEVITQIEFGKGIKHGAYLYACTDSALCVWDLLTIRKLWYVTLEGETLNITSDIVTGNLAVVSKDAIKILDPVEQKELITFSNVNATGGAVFGKYRNVDVLYFLTYNGLIKTIGPKLQKLKNIHPKTTSVGTTHPLLAAHKSEVTPMEIVAETVRGTSEDLNALLTVPIHALPSTSALAPSFIAKRIRALPKSQVLPNVTSETYNHPQQSNEERRIKQTFSSDIRDVSLDFNSYCKTFKANPV